jgi:hypothetical protein
VARGKLKNRTKTFLANPLCRGVDALCTKQLESRAMLFADVEFFKDDAMTSKSETMELLREN